jgi:uncharacterized membrane protein
MPAFYHPRINTPTEMMLAGQPPESWQSSEQDQTRPAWQSYSPPTADGNETYAYPNSGPAAPQPYGQGGYAQQGGYAAPAYTAQDQAYVPPEQTYVEPGYQGQQQAQPAPHWRAVQGMTDAKRKAKGDGKGFLGSLFDFSFTSFVTPKIIKVLYVLATVWTVIWALVYLRYGFKYGGAAGGFAVLIIVDPILILLTLGAFRLVLELFMIAYRVHEDLKAMRERGEN